MTKEQKHLGVPKPKYSPSKNESHQHAYRKSKPYSLVIPEREPTARELEEVQTGAWQFVSFIAPWHEMTLGRYVKYSDAIKALMALRKKQKGGDWFTCRLELNRAEIMNTNKVNKENV